MVGHAGAHPAPPSWSQARCRQREKCQTKNESGNKAKKISPADVVPAWTNYLECKINRFPFYPDAQPSASDVGIKLVQGNIPPLLISKLVFFDDNIGSWIMGSFGSCHCRDLGAERGVQKREPGVHHHDSRSGGRVEQPGHALDTLTTPHHCHQATLTRVFDNAQS